VNIHAEELAESRRCEGDDRKVVWIGDSATAGTDVYWCQPLSRWVLVELEKAGVVHFADDIALVRLDDDADSGPMEQKALASDLEGDALWIVDAGDLERLQAMATRSKFCGVATSC